LLNDTIIVLDYEPKLFFWQREHSGQVYLVAVIKPEAFLLTDNFGESCLIFS